MYNVMLNIIFLLGLTLIRCTLLYVGTRGYVQNESLNSIHNRRLKILILPPMGFDPAGALGRLTSLLADRLQIDARIAISATLTALALRRGSPRAIRAPFCHSVSNLDSRCS